MRWFVLIASVAAWMGVAEAAPDPNVNFGTVSSAGAVRYMNATAANLDATFPLMSASISDDPDGWFQFADAACNGEPFCTFPTAITLGTEITLIPFRCAPPPDAIGTRVARVAFQPASGVIQPFLVCTASGAAFQLTPPSHVLDFGGIDLHPTGGLQPAKSVIRVKNIGNSPETIGPGTVSGAQFTATPFASQTLQPGAEVAVTISYTPTVENDPNNPDHGTYQIDRSVGAGLVFTLAGHGVDKHASIASVGTVPVTFVKPGGAAPTIDVTVANTGGAVLSLKSARVVGDSWVLENPDPVDMPGHSTFPYHLRFAPTVAGVASPATLTITTTDPLASTLTATLTGTGKERRVTMGPETIDLQYVAVGTTAKISDGTRGDLLSITNEDPNSAFDIRSLVILGGEQAFAIPDAVGTRLPPSTTLTFDVSFSPLHVGSYDATAELRLDADPDTAASVALHGDAVFVDAVGGGGCSVGGGGGLALVVAVLLFAVRRRRAVVLGSLALASLSATAGADTRNLDLAIFDPTPSTTASWFQLQGAEVGRENDWAASALVSYANNPLTLDTAPNDNVAIADRMMFLVGGAYAFGDRFEAGLKFPLYVQSGENLNSSTMFGEPTASGTAAGDLAVHAKARLFGYHGPIGGLAVGVSAALALPTGTEGQFAGSGKPQLDALALISFVPAKLHSNLSLSAQAGTVLRAAAQFHQIDQGNGMLWGLGASYRVRPAFAVEAEVFGQLIPGGLHDAPTGIEAMGPAHALDAIEGLLGLHYQMERRVNVGLALGRGLTSAPGTPAWRGVFAVTFAPTAERTIGSRRAAGDSDHDGIPNDVDKCPDEAEDKDGFEDDDGCPDWDNDGDGIADAKDKCPNVAEDRDGFEDEDGCPDIDNDKDGILDRFDHCPNEPETINGIDDDDGCPDKGEGLVSIDKTIVNVGEPIQLTASGKIAPASFNVLGQLGATLRAHTELIKLRVTAHAKNRAQTVIDWLVQYGIAAERLEAATADPASDAIEFTIVDRY